MKLPKTKGWARKVARPLVCTSAVGWIAFVVGFSLFYNPLFQSGITSNVLQMFAPYWIFLANGPLLYIFSILHLLYGNSLTGLATNFFTTISLVSGGAVLWHTGVLIDLSRVRAAPEISATFGGCLISVVFLVITVLLWPFFIINTPECCMNLTEQDRVAFSGRCSQQPQEAKQASITMQPNE